jgi:hypothetical protein
MTIVVSPKVVSCLGRKLDDRRWRLGEDAG